MERCAEWGEAEARFREVKITSPYRALMTFHRTERGFTAYNASLEYDMSMASLSDKSLSTISRFCRRCCLILRGRSGSQFREDEITSP